MEASSVFSGALVLNITGPLDTVADELAPEGSRRLAYRERPAPRVGCDWFAVLEPDILAVGEYILSGLQSQRKT